VIRKVRAGLMPPPGLPRDTAALKAFASSLANSIDQAAAGHPNPADRHFTGSIEPSTPISVHDLLSVDADVAALLPVDDMSHGFDNIGGRSLRFSRIDGRLYPRGPAESAGKRWAIRRR